jgi:hypothetical protein
LSKSIGKPCHCDGHKRYGVIAATDAAWSGAGGLFKVKFEVRYSLGGL